MDDPFEIGMATDLLESKGFVELAERLRNPWRTIDDPPDRTGYFLVECRTMLGLLTYSIVFYSTRIGWIRHGRRDDTPVGWMELPPHSPRWTNADGLARLEQQ